MSESRIEKMRKEIYEIKRDVCTYNERDDKDYYAQPGDLPGFIKSMNVATHTLLPSG